MVQPRPASALFVASGTPLSSRRMPSGGRPRLVLAHALRGALVVPARAVAGGLDVEAVIDPVHDDLLLAHRLHVAAHHAEAHPGLAAPGREARDDGLERPLARRIDVGMAVPQREQLAAILEHEAEPVRHQAGAHAAEVRLDHRHHHAGRVGDGEVGGVAVAGRVAGPHRPVDAVGTDQRARAAPHIPWSSATRPGSSRSAGRRSSGRGPRRRAAWPRSAPATRPATGSPSRAGRNAPACSASAAWPAPACSPPCRTPRRRGRR